MFTLFTILVLLSAFAAVGFISRRFTRQTPQLQTDNHNEPRLRGLFEPDEAELRAWQNEQEKLHSAEALESLKREILVKAQIGDLNALVSANSIGVEVFYQHTLEILSKKEDSDSLESFLSKNGLPANQKLANIFLDRFGDSASSLDLARALLLAASTNSAEVYLQAMEKTVSLWDGHKQKEVSSETLIELFETHYWLLANEARISGAGFLLKERLAGMRREILESNRASVA